MSVHCNTWEVERGESLSIQGVQSQPELYESRPYLILSLECHLLQVTWSPAYVFTAGPLSKTLGTGGVQNS